MSIKLLLPYHLTGYRDLHAGLLSGDFVRKEKVDVVITEEGLLLFGFEELFHIRWTPFLRMSAMLRYRQTLL